MNENGFLAAIILIVIIVIAAIIVAALLSRQRDEDKGVFGDSCASDSDCNEGQCLKGICSLPKGSNCTLTINCEPGTECINGVCSETGIPIGGTCDNTTICESPLVCNLGTCKSKSGGPCSNNSQCVSGMCDTTTNICSSTGTGMSVLDLLTPMNAGPVIPVTDVAGDNNVMLTLQNNGSIIMDDGRTASTVFSSVKLDLICWSKSAVFGVSHGKLYIVNEEFNRLYWNWYKYRQSPDNITHICCTLDNEYLWVETRIPKGRKRGYIYKIGSHGTIKLVSSKLIKGTKIYGRNKDEYAVLYDGECSIYRRKIREDTMIGITGVGFDPDNGKIITSEKYFRVIKALGVPQVAIS